MLVHVGLWLCVCVCVCVCVCMCVHVYIQVINYSDANKRFELYLTLLCAQIGEGLNVYIH